jgi:hypothetical protein
VKKTMNAKPTMLLDDSDDDLEFKPKVLMEAK